MALGSTIIRAYFTSTSLENPTTVVDLGFDEAWNQNLVIDSVNDRLFFDVDVNSRCITLSSFVDCGNFNTFGQAFGINSDLKELYWMDYQGILRKADYNGQTSVLSDSFLTLLSIVSFNNSLIWSDQTKIAVCDTEIQNIDVVSFMPATVFGLPGKNKTQCIDI